MIDTFEALGVFLLAALPGALYTWGYERQVGQWGATAADRVLRFVAGSAVFHALFAPVTYWIWLRFVHSGRFSGHGPVPLYLWAIALAYVSLPFVAGSISGQFCRSPSQGWRAQVSNFLSGPNPAPRAWDHVFAHQHRPAWVRLKLKSGGYVGGLYSKLDGERAYASGFPFDQELFLVRTARLDQTGTFLYDNGRPVIEPFGIMVRWDEVEYLTIEEVASGT
jgi:hypothetical protein